MRRPLSDNHAPHCVSFCLGSYIRIWNNKFINRSGSYIRIWNNRSGTKVHTNLEVF
ncbi:hypothetical protein HanRHA438_Chr14g0667171 [Helianthus annuus]|uniref:Uncharacterized protein n=1 Tax=Helianthus annuus TaxID=4232 RepID=A0A251UGP6_HELAN|nr:hypothetical protein HanXRQr2_Chr11g0507171 [Helianthus annuus]KAJ0848520.1 hypothetical protein HanPSC8_Chr13g0558451 [Helianthus annuus]KAJ0854859.1 hypothetical protein HanRHA438_Chr14g0667171 [Helianthus annuus]